MVIFTEQIVIRIIKVKYLSKIFIPLCFKRQYSLLPNKPFMTQLYPLSSEPVTSKDTLSLRILQFNSFMAHLLQKFALTDLMTGFA